MNWERRVMFAVFLMLYTRKVLPFPIWKAIRHSLLVNQSTLFLPTQSLSHHHHLHRKQVKVTDDYLNVPVAFLGITADCTQHKNKQFFDSIRTFRQSLSCSVYLKTIFKWIYFLFLHLAKLAWPTAIFYAMPYHAISCHMRTFRFYRALYFCYWYIIKKYVIATIFASGLGAVCWLVVIMGYVKMVKWDIHDKKHLSWY